MTTEQRNQILDMHRNQGMKQKDIAAIIGVTSARINIFLKETEDVLYYVSCLNCGKSLPVRKGVTGKKPKYCCKECKYEDYRNNKRRRHVIHVCEHCGKEYKQYSFIKSRFCSRACANKHRYGKQ